MNLQFLIKPLTQFFDLINSGVMSIISNKGVAYFVDIFIFTLILKTILLPLQIKQTKSMVKMNEMQPKLKEIQEKFKNDPQKLQQKQMELYKEAGVNPLAGCLPMLVQLPIFMAMYAVIYSYPGFKDPSIKFLGITLSNTHNILLAILSGITTYASGRILTPAQPATSTGNDPAAGMTKNMNVFMSIFIVYMSWTVKAGLVLYWIISNILTFLQQYFIVNKIREKEQSKVTNKVV